MSLSTRAMSPIKSRTLLGLALAVLAFAPIANIKLSAQESDDASKMNSIGPDAGPAESLVASFTGTNGATPRSSLVKDANGLYYGTTSAGGTNGDGTIFTVSTAGVVTTLYNFGATVGSSIPENPYGALIQGTDGNFYGTTYSDATPVPGSSPAATYGSGVIFKFVPNSATAPTGGTLTILHQFEGNTVIPPATSGPGDGKHVEWALVEGTDGYLYGQTHGGGTGTSTSGIIFKIEKNGSNYTIIHSFNAAGTDGNSPLGGLIEGTNTAPDGTNYFYGMTEIGGANGVGNVFKVSASGTYFYDLADFNYNATTPLSGPAEPYGTPVFGTDGKTLYGVSFEGGIATTGSSPTSNDGVFFSIEDEGTTAIITPLYAFAGHSDPGKPEAGIILGSDGNFYGTSEAAGGNSDGAIFEVTPAGVETVEYAFKGGTTDGSTPLGNPVESPSGDLYLTASKGGVDSDGAIIELKTGLAVPITLNLSTTSTQVGIPVTITYSSLIAYGATMSQCFATSTTPTNGTDPNWTGIKTLNQSNQTATVIPTEAGTYNYALTCGGSNSTSNVNQGVLTVATPTNGLLTFSSTSHDFGQVDIGTAASAYGIKVTNSGSAAYPFSLSFTAGSGFTSATNCPTSIAAGASCELVFYFTPTATGEVSKSWSVVAETGFGYSPEIGGTLTGSGTSSGGVSVTTGGHNFGVLANGVQSGTYGTELSNSTTSAVTLTLGSVTSPFTSLTNCGTTLAAGSSCELEFYATGNTSTSTTTQTYSISVNGGAIPLTANGVTITGITLTGN